MSDNEVIDRYYQSLFTLKEHPWSQRVLDETLSHLGALTEADFALLELWDADQLPSYWRGYHVDSPSLDVIRSLVDRSIVARAISERRTIIATCPPASNAERTGCATAIVLCILIKPANPVGIVYLRSGHEAFSSLDQDRAEIFASLVAELPELAGAAGMATMTLQEQTEAFEERRVGEAMLHYRGNVSKVARELGVSRGFVYAVTRRRA